MSILRALDKIWCNECWAYIKWPFGVLVLWFVLWLIWNQEMNPAFEKDIVNKSKEVYSEVKSIQVPRIDIGPGEKIKNVK